jgi:hypothetical protein
MHSAPTNIKDFCNGFFCLMLALNISVIKHQLTRISDRYMKLVMSHNLVSAANGAIPHFSIGLHEVVTVLE